MVPFRPLVKNPHVLTILGNFWPRRLDIARFPVTQRVFETAPEVRVRAACQRPSGALRGRIVMVHGLESSSEAGYQRSMAARALEEGFAVYRLNMRSCGGTESLARTNYHAGLTADTLAVLREVQGEDPSPLFLCGFSLGANVTLKLAGELGDDPLLAGAVAVSAPIDLRACVDRLDARQNKIYSERFLRRLKGRIRRRAVSAPELYDASHIGEVRSIFEFDDRYTAPPFGFRGADHYYRTQSAKNFLDAIRIPTLLVHAKDDPLIPFHVYEHPAFRSNKNLELITPDHGGHLGFIARGPRRLWLDAVVVDWIRSRAGERFTCPR